jgi:hypothetical protein
MTGALTSTLDSAAVAASVLNKEILAIEMLLVEMLLVEKLVTETAQGDVSAASKY